MSTYLLQDGNRIVADQAFIDAHFPGAELLPEPVQTSGVPQSVSRAQGKAALGLGDEQLDALFVAAGAVRL